MIDKNELPKGWKWVKLGEILSVSSGKGLKINSLAGGKYPVYGGNGINGYHTDYFLEYPKLIIGRVGVKCGVVHITKSKAWVTDNALIVDPLIPDFNLSYFRYRLEFENLNKLSVSTAQPVISGRNIYQVQIPLPPLSTQHAIVAKIEQLFSELDKGKEQLETARQQLKVYRQAVLKWAFEGKLTEEWRKKQKSLVSLTNLLTKIRLEREKQAKSNEVKLKPIVPISDEELSNLPNLPDGMYWIRLGELLWSVKDGPHYSPKYQDSGIPFISGGNIRPEGIDFTNSKFISGELHIELSKRCRPERGDILYTKGGTTGIARVNTYDIDFNVWVHVAVLKKIDSVDPFYLQYALNSKHCYRQSQIYTHGVGNQDLGLTRMVLITLPICSIEEQHRIVAEIESRLSVCDQVEATIAHSLGQAEALRQSVLKRAFEGRLV